MRATRKNRGKGRQTVDEFDKFIGGTGGAGHFIVYRSDGRDSRRNNSLPLQRRDFYKISLVTKGEGVLSFGDEAIPIKNRMLAFLNPQVPYAWEPISTSHKGYSCLFTEQFISNVMVSGPVKESPLFMTGGNHVLIPTARQMEMLEGLFSRMLVEMDGDYAYNYDLLRNYVQILLHEALKIQPPGARLAAGGAHAWLHKRFRDVLEQQFPVLRPGATIRLKNAGEFADTLGVHPNHLNRVLRHLTGSTTTELISERILKEARALLRNTDWEMADIGESLGFGHASNFIIFFRRHMGMTPARFRQQTVVI